MNPVKVVNELAKSAYQAVEYLNELTERDTAKIVNIDPDDAISRCPNCHVMIGGLYHGKFCSECGQRLEWTR